MGSNDAAARAVDEARDSVKRAIREAAAAVVAAAKEKERAALEAADGAAAAWLAERVEPVAAEAAAAAKQAAHLAELVPELVGAADGGGLLSLRAGLEAEVARLMAVQPAAVTAPMPDFTCRIDVAPVIAALQSCIAIPVVQALRPLRPPAQSQLAAADLSVLHSLAHP